MERALQLAGRARGRTTPNPQVGAVVVTPGGVVAGAGYHEQAGEPHAEIHALREAGEAARGATLYCTLEPCRHFGRTPPCVDAILQAGIGRVVAAVADPSPRSGGGFHLLRDAGVRVDVGVGEVAARRLMRPFFSAVRRGRPYVIVKAVTSLDGRVAEAVGRPTRLSDPAADRRTHLLRAEVDAIAIGSGTLLADDPLLTVRGVYRRRPLARVVFDRRLRTPVSARLFGTLDAGPVFVVTGSSPRTDAVRALEAAGAHVLAADGLDEALRRLLPFGIQSLLVDGGPTLHARLFREGAADAVRLVVTPRVLGEGGVPWVEHAAAPWASWRLVSAAPCGGDVIIEADVHWTD